MMKPRICLSPNFDDRPQNVEVDTVVLHATVLNTLDEVVTHFSNPEAKVSAHYTIDRDGTIVAHVPEDKRAWHAGISKMKDGRTSVNDFSVGIELVNLNDGIDPFPEEQIQAMRSLVRSIVARHPDPANCYSLRVCRPARPEVGSCGFHPRWVDGLLT
jgi:N-acetyl-anhydromuramyl-L-alanine amidase AmpD